VEKTKGNGTFQFRCK
jgi:calpain, invertebrate